MSRFVILAWVLGLVAAASAQTAPPSDPTAVSLLLKSVAALTGGNVISDVTLNANVISIAGSDYDTGTGLLRAKGLGESRVDLSFNGKTRSDVRSVTANGIPTGAWKKDALTPTAYAQHNCWTGAAWFFPALLPLTQTANVSFVFKYIGQEQYNGSTAHHIQMYQVSSQNPYLAKVSSTDFYFDATSLLPLGAKFNLHADQDMNVDIPSEVRFASYQSVSGVLIPFHFQRLQNGGLVLDATVTSAVINSGLADSIFTLQ